MFDAKCLLSSREAPEHCGTIHKTRKNIPLPKFLASCILTMIVTMQMMIMKILTRRNTDNGVLRRIYKIMLQAEKEAH